MFEIQDSNDWSTPSSRLSSASPNHLAIADVAVSARRGRIRGDGIRGTVTDEADLGSSQQLLPSCVAQLESGLRWRPNSEEARFIL